MSKKSFKDINPAMAFITDSKDYTHNTDNTHNTYKAETKSKRLNILLTPSLHADLTKIARVQGESLNNLINEVLKAYEEENKPTIKKYTDIWG
jgi:predicted HicB family RNase H-like nuclease